MDTLEVLRKRRSIKDFSPNPVPREVLLELVDVARHSPSGSNKNPWRFVLITGRESLDGLSQTHPHCRWLASAQAGMALVADPASSKYWLEDCCVAAYAIWLAATDRGLGVAWAAMYQGDNPQESERRQALVRQALNIPPKYNVPMVLGLGYPRTTPPPRKMLLLQEVVSWERYPTDWSQ